jgi:hypothetical protein
LSGRRGLQGRDRLRGHGRRGNRRSAAVTSPRGFEAVVEPSLISARGALARLSAAGFAAYCSYSICLFWIQTITTLSVRP